MITIKKPRCFKYIITLYRTLVVNKIKIIIILSHQPWFFFILEFFPASDFDHPISDKPGQPNKLPTEINSAGSRIHTTRRSRVRLHWLYSTVERLYVCVRLRLLYGAHLLHLPILWHRYSFTSLIRRDVITLTISFKG